METWDKVMTRSLYEEARILQHFCLNKKGGKMVVNFPQIAKKSKKKKNYLEETE